MVDVTLSQIEQLSASEKESVVLIFGGKEMLRQSQYILKQCNIPFSLMDGQKTLYQLHYVKNLLLYLYLIEDKSAMTISNAFCVTISFPIWKTQILTLKKLANRKAFPF